MLLLFLASFNNSVNVIAKAHLNGNRIQKGLVPFPNKGILIKYLTLICTTRLSAFQRRTGSTFDLPIIILMADDLRRAIN